MPQFHPNEAAFSSLKDKVVVLTGGSTGIGAATVTILASHGANVVLGDINKDAADNLVNSLNSKPNHGKVTFVPCDVTNYKDLYTLFKTAHDTHGRVDHALSNAGIFEIGKWFDPDLTIDNVGDAGPGPSAVIDINVMGTANFSRVAVPFLAHGMQKGENRSLTVLSSVNAFRESPGLYMYQTSKHATQGLMRAMRKPLHDRHNLRVNAVCPGVTESEMTRHIVSAFKSANLYWQPSSAVATIIVGMMVDEGLHGEAVYIEGGDGWAFEEGFREEMPRWLGEEATRRMRVNSEAVQKGALTKARE